MSLTAPLNQIGVTIYACEGAPATLDAAGFGDLTWDEVHQAEEFPEHGATSEDQTVMVAKTGLALHYNGGKDGGVYTIPYVYQADSAGQNILRNNKNGAGSVSLKIVERDGMIKYILGVVGPVRWMRIHPSVHKGQTAEIRTHAEPIEVAP